MPLKYSVVCDTLSWMGYDVLESPQKILQTIKDAGYDGADLPGNPQRVDAAELRRIVESVGLEVPEVLGAWAYFHAGEDRNMAGGDEQTRRRGIDYAKRGVDLAADLGAVYFQLCAATFLGALCGILGGGALSAVFALFAFGFAVNQVATGLALTILAVGTSGLVGAGFVGVRIAPAPHLDIPLLTDLPFVGSILFGQDGFIYFSVVLVACIWWFLHRTRAGLVLRACGDNHTSAHALGYPVVKIRWLAVLFGGGCAGLGGAYLPLAYTPFFVPEMTAGRGWIALALVVFASWRPGRLVGGAFLFGAVTILQLQAQSAGIRIPTQLMSSLPYLACIVVLILISRTRGSTAPASLGKVFVPDR